MAFDFNQIGSGTYFTDPASGENWVISRKVPATGFKYDGQEVTNFRNNKFIGSPVSNPDRKELLCLDSDDVDSLKFRKEL